MPPPYALSITPGRLAIVKLPPKESGLPEWARRSDFLAFIQTPDEITVVCNEQVAPFGFHSERGWRALRVQGPLNFSLVGVLASLIVPLTVAEVSIFVLSTFDTDYLLVKEYQLSPAIQALRSAGHDVLD